MRSTVASAVWLARGLLLGALALACAAQTPTPTPADTATAGALVREVVDNELREEPVGNYRFREWSESADGSKTKAMVETLDGVVSRVVALNDHPLTPAQDKAEQERLNHLLAHPEIQRQKKKDQQQDEEHMQKMFRDLPRAFLYQPLPAAATDVIHLGFQPNPKFDPSSREAAVFKGMSGEMWIDARQKRLIRIEGALFRDVTFGWGLLGRLDKGGHFSVRQAEIGPGRWETVELDIHFTGKALLFKSISLRERSRYSDFRPVPQRLTLAQGVELLSHGEPEQTASAAAR